MEQLTSNITLWLKTEVCSRTFKSRKHTFLIREGRKKLKKKITCAVFLAMLALTLTFRSNIVSSQETPLIYVDPPSVVGVSPSQNFMIAVKVANVTNLYGFDIKLRWDPEILDYVSHIAKIPISTYPDGVIYEPMITLKDEVNETAGTYWLAASSLFPAPSFNGTGIFFEMTFHVKTIGRCLIEIYSSDLADKSGKSIPHNKENGFFSNYVPTPARIYVDPSKVVNADLTPSNNFTVDVNLDEVVDLENLEFWLGYNTTILDVVNVTANPLFSPPVTIDIFETEGRMRVKAFASPSISGNLTLATIIFHVAGTGESVLDLHNITLIDEWGDSIPYDEPVDGYFSNVLKAKLFVNPPELIDPTLSPGSEFSIDIQIDDVFELYGYAFYLSYDTNVLTCLGAVIFPPTNDTHFTMEISIVDQMGEIAINVSYYHPAEPITILSNTTVMTIYFQVQSYGCTVLDLHGTLLTDQYGGSIPHDVGDGFFCTLIADVAVVGVELSQNFVYPGRTVNITVIVANLGDTTETFDVTAYYDNNTIGTQTVFDLPAGQNYTAIFIWNTSGLEPCNNYTISAKAGPVPYELDLTNNVYVDGWVKIKILGDVDSDGKVDIFDIVLAADAYGSCEGDPNWNSEADTAPRYGIIDIYDLVTISGNYGKGC